MRVPEWYWEYGLHDAIITSVTKKESAWNPENNRLILKIDAKGALCEINITEIRFYNVKFLTTGFDTDQLKDSWWMEDELKWDGRDYLLELEFINAHGNKKRVKFKFQNAEVFRKEID